MPLLELILFIASTEPEDPWTLPIRSHQVFEAKSPGAFTLPGQLPAGPKEIARDLDGHRFFLLGEQHDARSHKELLAEIIRELEARGRRVTVGFEMFTWPNQSNLDPYTRGFWSEPEFIEKSNWKAQWGFEFNIYKPVFDAVRDLKLPMVALNVPRDWVRAVGRGGLSALPDEARGQLPAFDPNHADHARYFNAMLGGHPTANVNTASNMQSAQTLWDVGMAHRAFQWSNRASNSPNHIMVILAGSGHAAYGLGINRWLEKFSGRRVPTLVAFTGAPRPVSKGLGDWVAFTP